MMQLFSFQSTKKLLKSSAFLQLSLERVTNTIQTSSFAASNCTVQGQISYRNTTSIELRQFCGSLKESEGFFPRFFQTHFSDKKKLKSPNLPCGFSKQILLAYPVSVAVIISLFLPLKQAFPFCPAAFTTTKLPGQKSLQMYLVIIGT